MVNYSLSLPWTAGSRRSISGGKATHHLPTAHEHGLDLLPGCQALQVFQRVVAHREDVGSVACPEAWLHVVFQ